MRKKVAAILDVLFRLGQDAARARARHRHHRRQDLATPSCARQAASRCIWSAPGPPVSAWFRRRRQSMRRTMKSRHSATARRIAVHRRACHHRRHVAQTTTPPTPTMAASRAPSYCLSQGRLALAGVVLGRPEHPWASELHGRVAKALHNPVAKWKRSRFADVDHGSSPPGSAQHIGGSGGRDNRVQMGGLSGNGVIDDPVTSCGNWT